MSCWESVKEVASDILSHIEGKTGIKYNPETGEGKEAYLKAVNELRNQTVDDLVSIHKQIKGEAATPPPKTPELPKEEAGGEEKKVGVSHKSLTNLANELGLKEPEHGTFPKLEDIANRGRKLLEAGADPNEIDNPKNELHDRISIARAHLEDLTIKADNIGKEKGVQSDEYKLANKEIEDYSEKVKKLGTSAGQALYSLQGERDINTGSFTEVKKAYEKNKGSQATPEQEQKIADLTKENEDLKQKVADTEKKLIEATDKELQKNKNKANKIIEGNKKTKDDEADLIFQSAKRDFVAARVAKEVEEGKTIEESVDGIAKEGLIKPENVEKAKKYFNDLVGEEKGSKNKLPDLQEQFADKVGNKFTTDEAKSIWDYAKSEYLNKGVQYKDMISYVGNDLGLTFDQVYNAIVTPKTKPIADAMWISQKNLREAQFKTKDFVDNANKSTFTKVIEFPDKLMRGTAVFGHGGIFVGTHAGMTTFDLPRAKYTIKAFANGYRFAYGNEAKYEREMQKLKDNPNYILAQRAGLQNDPNETKTDQYQKSQEYLGKVGIGGLGKLFKIAGESGVKGFNAIKILRQDLFDDHWNSLTAAEKADPSSAASIAELVNNATGATNLDLKLRDKKGNVIVNPDKILFAANMEAARWEKLTKNPVKATGVALKALFAPSKATPAERVFAKVWASRVGWELSTYAGLIFTNAAIQSYINPKNPVNLTDPTKPDYLKMKAGETDINMTSGMLGAIGFMAGLVNNSIKTKKERRGDNVLQADAKSAFAYGRGKLSPFAATLVDLKTKTDFGGNTLPYNSDKPAAGKHQLTWKEYAWEKAPIPVADAAKTMYESMVDNGMTKPKADEYLKGLVSFIEAGSTGFRISESYHKEEPFSDEDKGKPAFKYFIDKGMTLPNVSPASVPIKDYKTHTTKNLSEYPPEIIQKYKDEHKANLEKELQQVEKRGYVYVDKFGEISLNYPENGDGARKKKLDNLDEKELAEVLHKTQSNATIKTKEKLFPKK